MARTADVQATGSASASARSFYCRLFLHPLRKPALVFNGYRVLAALHEVGPAVEVMRISLDLPVVDEILQAAGGSVVAHDKELISARNDMRCNGGRHGGDDRKPGRAGGSEGLLRALAAEVSRKRAERRAGHAQREFEAAKDLEARRVQSGLGSVVAVDLLLDPSVYVVWSQWRRRRHFVIHLDVGGISLQVFRRRQDGTRALVKHIERVGAGKGLGFRPERVDFGLQSLRNRSGAGPRAQLVGRSLHVPGE